MKTIAIKKEEDKVLEKKELPIMKKKEVPFLIKEEVPMKEGRMVSVGYGTMASAPSNSVYSYMKNPLSVNVRATAEIPRFFHEKPHTAPKEYQYRAEDFPPFQSRNQPEGRQ